MKPIIINLILSYLRLLAHLQLKKNSKAIIIGVTGSAGKTSTRQAITHILRTRGKVKQSVKANSESGIPLNILGLHMSTYSALDWLRVLFLAPLMLVTNWQQYDYYVVEMGIDSPDEPKNMSYLLKIITPNVGVILNVGLAHAAAFDHLVKDRDHKRRSTKLRHLIAQEKMRLAHGIDRSGVAIINADQAPLIAHRAGLKARQITFGKSGKANVHIIDVSVGRAGFAMRLNYQGATYTLTLPDVYTEGYAGTFAAAIATAASLGISPAASIEVLKSYRAPAGRLRLLRGIRGSRIIDSSYNASPDTMQEALKLLSKLAGRAYKLAVLGDMRELGDSTKAAHKALADWILKYADEAILFGEATADHTLPVLESKKFPVRHFETMASLTSYLKQRVKSKSWILVKGSQNVILLERAVESILEDQNDVKLLCRRGSYWDQVRARAK